MHGVPFSVKEMYDIDGTYSTGGLAMFTREEYIANSKVVDMLMSLGAVPFCKTNVPQAMINCSALTIYLVSLLTLMVIIGSVGGLVVGREP